MRFTVGKWEGHEKSGEAEEITQYLFQCNVSVQVAVPTPSPLFLAINLMSLHMLQLCMYCIYIPQRITKVFSKRETREDEALRGPPHGKQASKLGPGHS